MISRKQFQTYLVKDGSGRNEALIANKIKDSKATIEGVEGRINNKDYLNNQ